MALGPKPIPAPVKESIDANPIDTSTVYKVTNKNPPITAIAGTPWVTTAYFQLLGLDDAPTQIDFNLDPTLQQYTRINNYVINVTATPNPTYDQATGITTATGSGNLHPGQAPNLGDHFVGRLVDGRLGFFVIKTINQLPIFAYIAYEVDFELYALHSDVIQNELNRKTVQTLSFDAASAGCPGAIGPDTTTMIDMAKTLERLVAWYYDEFYDLTSRTFINPEGIKRYDPMVVTFLNSIIDRELRGRRPLPHRYSAPSGEYEKEFRTVWDMMVLHESYLLPLICKTHRLVYAREFHSSYGHADLLTSHIREVIIPSREGTLTGTSSKPSTDYYVFSEAFYSKNIALMTNLEKLVYITLLNETITFNDLVTEINSLETTTPLVRFYHLPVLIWLVRFKIREKGHDN